MRFVRRAHPTFAIAIVVVALAACTTSGSDAGSSDGGGDGGGSTGSAARDLATLNNGPDPSASDVADYDTP